MFIGGDSMNRDELIITPKNPKGEDGYKVFSIRVKEDTVAKIDVISEQTGRSRNELVGIFLEHAIERCKIENK